MKKVFLITGLLITMIVSMAIVAYASNKQTTAYSGKYLLKGVLEVETAGLFKKQGVAMTVNTTSDAAYMDSRTHVLIQAIKNGDVIDTGVNTRSDIQAIASLKLSTDSFKARFFLVEPDVWLFRVTSSWVEVK